MVRKLNILLTCTIRIYKLTQSGSKINIRNAGVKHLRKKKSDFRFCFVFKTKNIFCPDFFSVGK